MVTCTTTNNKSRYFFSILCISAPLFLFFLSLLAYILDLVLYLHEPIPAHRGWQMENHRFMEWIEQLQNILLEWGYLGMFVSALLAATILPFSSDIVLGGLVAAGCNPVAIVAVATLGNWLGGLISYGMGWLGKMEWLEKYFGVKPETIAKQKARVDRWGPLLAITSWVPFVGDVFAIVLGFYKAKFLPTAWWLFVGKLLRYICEALLIYYVI